MSTVEVTPEESDSDAEEILGALTWLAEAHRNHDFVTERPPPLPEMIDFGARDLVPLRENLQYEPRSIAVSPAGDAAAIGTKSGEIRLVRWNEKQSAWIPHSPTVVSRSPDRAGPLSPVRALAFIGPDLLAAGSGRGEFHLFDARSGESWPEPVDKDATSTTHGWFDRFTDILTLIVPGAPITDGPVALGLTNGHALHLLIRERGRFRSVTTTAAQLGIPPRSGAESWINARLVGGVWAHDRLWVLSSTGFIVCLRPAARDSAAFPFEADTAALDSGYLKLQPIRRPAEYRGIRGCMIGLAVRVSDEIAVFRFAADGPNKPPHLVAPQQWETVRDVIDFTVGIPFFPPERARDFIEPAESGTGYKQNLRLPNPVWVIAATSQPGLRWIRWVDGEDGRLIPSVGSPVLHRPGFPSSTLYLQFGWRGGGRVAFIAYGLREHEFRIAPLIDKERAHEEIRTLVDRILQKADLLREACARSAGLCWWLLDQRIAVEFDATLWRPDVDSHELLRRLDASDLRSLLAFTVRRWWAAFQKRQAGPSDDGAARLNTLRTWIQLLLGRARELDDATLVPALAQQAVDALSRLTIGASSPDENSRDAWQEVGLFVGFLRKWFVYGYTYAEKKVGLYGLYHLNAHCKERLDALTYLTLLLRQRADLSWERQLGDGGTAPTLWALATPEDGTFSVHSDAQGAIHALSNSGEVLDWVVAPSAVERLRAAQLDVSTLSGGGEALRRIRHVLAEKYTEKYHQGPYARRLLLFPAEGGRHVLVFAFRGWRDADTEPLQRDQDRERRSARMFAMLIDAGSNKGQVRVLDVDSFPTFNEIYGLCRVPSPSSAHPGAFTILAGTTGVWRLSDGGYEPTPFIDVRLIVERDRITKMKPTGRPVKPLADAVGSPYGLPTTHNPCWSLTAVREKDATWAWAGFHDGQIRCYRYDETAETGAGAWLDGGGPRELEQPDAPMVSRPRRVGLQATSGVWQLRLFSDRRHGEGAQEAESGERWLLSYGTANGTIGVLEVPREGDPTLPAHIVHTREAAPICGLVDYEEDGTTKLMALTQEGMACVFDVGSGQRRRPSESDSQGGHRWKFSFSGLRLDRFRVGHSVRAAAVTRGAAATGESQGRPALLLATADGRVSERGLLATYNSAPRRELGKEANNLLSSILAGAESPSANEARTSGSIADVVDCVGNATVYKWLRLVDVGGDHLLRFAVWHELRSKGTHFLEKFANGVADCENVIDEYLDLLRDLSGELFLRQPFSREPPKIVWDEGADFANELCRRALSPHVSPPDRQALLEGHYRVVLELDHICNRWIGHEPSIEAKVLMHVFDAIFGGAEVMLIARNADSLEEWAKTRPLRRFLVQSLLQRRLNHANPIVAVEALLTVSRAMLRAIVMASSMNAKPGETGWSFGFFRADRPTSEDLAGDADLGLYEVVAMVGAMTTRLQATFTSPGPLFTEVSRFFGLCLLLCPDSALLVAQVVSESGLMALSEAIVEHARLIRSRLRREYGISGAEKWDGAIERFRGFTSMKAGDGPPTLARPPTGDAFPPRPSRGDLTDDDFQLEQAAAYAAVEELRNLESTIAIPWLERDEGDIHYFQHSFRFLQWAQRERAKLRGALTSNGAVLKPSEDCKALLRLLATEVDLYEPHRSRYRRIFESWETTLQRHAQNAVVMLDLVEGFNRHVYRASGDDLVAAATELALQTAPLFPRSESDRPHVERVETALAQNPLVRDIYSHGVRLAEASQLVGILITIAGDTAKRQASRAERGSISLKRVLALLERIAEQEQLRPKRVEFAGMGDAVERRSVPGTVAIWEAILREWAKNARKYGSTGGLLKYGLDVSEGYARLRVAGEHSFGKSVYGKTDDTIENLMVRLGNEHRVIRSSDGHGYGLRMIFLLCQFVGLTPSLRLDVIDPEIKDETKYRHNPDKPLCLSILIPDAPEEQ